MSIEGLVFRGQTGVDNGAPFVIYKQHSNHKLECVLKPMFETRATNALLDFERGEQASLAKAEHRLPVPCVCPNSDAEVNKQTGRAFDCLCEGCATNSNLQAWRTCLSIEKPDNSANNESVRTVSALRKLNQFHRRLKENFLTRHHKSSFRKMPYMDMGFRSDLQLRSSSQMLAQSNNGFEFQHHEDVSKYMEQYRQTSVSSKRDRSTIMDWRLSRGANVSWERYSRTYQPNNQVRKNPLPRQNPTCPTAMNPVDAEIKPTQTFKPDQPAAATVLDKPQPRQAFSVQVSKPVSLPNTQQLKSESGASTRHKTGSTANITLNKPRLGLVAHSSNPYVKSRLRSQHSSVTSRNECNPIWLRREGGLVMNAYPKRRSVPDTTIGFCRRERSVDWTLLNQLAMPKHRSGPSAVAIGTSLKIRTKLDMHTGIVSTFSANGDVKSSNDPTKESNSGDEGDTKNKARMITKAVRTPDSSMSVVGRSRMTRPRSEFPSYSLQPNYTPSLVHKDK